MEIVGAEPEESSRSPSRNDPDAARSGSLSRKASLNAAAAGLDFAARTVVELVLNPLMLRGLGDYLFGAWRMLWRLTGYLWATSGRAAQALQSAIANRLHSDDIDEKRRLVGASIVVWALYLPLLVVVTALAIWKLPALLDAPAQDVAPLRWTILLLGVDSVMVSLLTIPRATLQGENLGYRRMGLSTALVLISGVLTAVALWLDSEHRRRRRGQPRGDDLHRRRVLEDHSRPRSMVRRRSAAPAGGPVVLRPQLVVHGVEARQPVDDVGRRARPRRRRLGRVGQRLRADEVHPRGDAATPVDARDGRYSRTRRDHRRRRPPTSAARPGRGPRPDVAPRASASGVAILMWNESFVALWVGEQYFAGGTELLLLMISLLQLALIRSDAFIIDLTLKVRAKTLTGLASSVIALGGRRLADPEPRHGHHGLVHRPDHWTIRS